MTYAFVIFLSTAVCRSSTYLTKTQQCFFSFLTQIVVHFLIATPAPLKPSPPVTSTIRTTTTQSSSSAASGDSVTSWTAPQEPSGMTQSTTVIGQKVARAESRIQGPLKQWRHNERKVIWVWRHNWGSRDLGYVIIITEWQMLL